MSYRDHDKESHYLAAWLSAQWTDFQPYRREGNWDKDDDRPNHWATIWSNMGYGIHLSRLWNKPRLDISACIPHDWRNKGAYFEESPSISVSATKGYETIKRDIENRLIGKAKDWFSEAKKTHDACCDFEQRKARAIEALKRFGFREVSHSDTLYGPFGSSFRVDSDTSIRITVDLNLMRAKQVAGLLNSLPKEKPNDED